MVSNDPPGTFRITCNSATSTYTADHYGIGHLPPAEALTPG